MMASMSGEQMFKKYRIHEGVKCMNQDELHEMYLNNTWRPVLAVTGIDGIPEVAKGGNVCRPSTTIKLSMRTAPNANAKACLDALHKKMTENIPYNCKVTQVGGSAAGQGWCMKEMPQWLKQAVEEAGESFYGGAKGKGYGVGGSIPLLAELDRMYPDSMIMAIGLIGPKANAHAPNEAINLTYAKKLTCSLSHMIAAAGLQR